jgi:SAM-dependent methyltransferase
MSVRYTHGHMRGILADHARRSAADSAGFLLPHLDAGMELLDMGCGPGSITRDLASHVRSVVGIDASRAAIAAAQSTAGPTVRFVVADAHRLPFADASFDVVYAHQVLQHLGDPVDALREARRVLRSGGLVAVRDADYGTMVHAPRDSRLDRWLDLYHQLAARNGAEADAGRNLLGWVTTAGFVEPVATTSTWTYTTPETIAGWRDLWVGRLVEGRMGRDLLAHGLITTAERDELVAAWSHWAVSDSPFFAFLHGEVVARVP